MDKKIDKDLLKKSNNDKASLLHIVNYDRPFNIFPKISSMGYFVDKTSIVNRYFSTFNFSFILSGEGFYIKNNEKIHCKAPCVILQWPNENLIYGPYPDKAGWEELFFIYHPEEKERLFNSNLFNKEDMYIREFAMSNNFKKYLAEIKGLLQSNIEITPDTAFMIDKLVLEFIFSSYEQENITFSDEVNFKIKGILDKNLSQKVDIKYLSKQLNMSKSTLRRHWQKSFNDMTFSDYRNQQFLLKSCQLLIETTQEIKQIADSLGFEDYYHFSRKFHKVCGMTASEYRKKHQIFYNKADTQKKI